MAKKKQANKRKASASSGKSSHSLWPLIRRLVSITLVIFVFLSVFNAAGTLGAQLHALFTQAIGVATPVVALYLIWFILHKFFPTVVAARPITVFGTFLLLVTITGFLHSFVDGDLNKAAQAGLGGGWLGNFVYSGLSSAVGAIITQIILTFLGLVAVTITFDKVILPMLSPAQEPKEDDEAPMQPVQMESQKVKVVGELGQEAARTKQRGFLGLGKPAVIAVDPKPAAPRVALGLTENWNYPPVSLLKALDEKPQAGNIQKRMELIQKTLRDFNIDVSMTDVRIGPTVSQYTLRPSEGVKLTQIMARQDDLALALAAESLRVEAPIPGKSLVGVEIPNDKKAKVGLQSIFVDKAHPFQEINSKLAIALGRDAAGASMVVDLAKMPHVLIAGSTGSGKSVCINTLILSLLMNNSPEELRMILVDPKRVELSMYNGLPHLMTPVLTEPKDTVKALNWAVKEMERRYKVLQSCGKRNIVQYNQEPTLNEGKMPYLVVVIDELADLMLVAARDVEQKIVRIAQMARAVGIHLVLATQRPSVDVLTGLIKANIPTRIAFAVTSQIDSRTIIDSAGAEKLLGQGDMLYLSTDLGKPRRIQGVFCTEEEMNAVVAFIRQQSPEDRYDPSILEDQVESRFVTAGGLDDEEENLVREAYDLVRKYKKASTSMLQTHMRLGYNKAKRIITAMEERGMIGPERGGKQREVFEMNLSEEISEQIEPDSIGIAAYPDND
jgi:DNA segregation ATPase FtsK/SpoIIIE, S-DNA-T family